MGYGSMGHANLYLTLFLNLVLAHKTFHTAHVWKYKAQSEHNYFTSNYHHT